MSAPGRRPADPAGRSRRHLVVCGDDALALRLVDELIARRRVEVTVILPSRRRNHGPLIARLPVRIVEAERLDEDAFRQARLATAAAVAIVRQDDVGNIHAALQAQEVNPTIRLVLRMFNMSLGHGVRRLFADCAVLSDASMAAPAFVAAALGEEAPAHIRLPGRTLYVARRGDVRPADIVCGLAITDEGAEARPELLPSDQSRADLVLVVANGAPAPLGPSNSPVGGGDPSADGGALATSRRPDPGADPGVHWLRRPRWSQRRSVRSWLRRIRHPFGLLSTVVNRNLGLATLALLGLLVAATFALARAKDVSLVDAAYLTFLDTFGGAEPDLEAGPLQKATEALLTLINITFIPVVAGLVAAAVVNARLALAAGRLRRPIDDHVVVVGLGYLGSRVIRQLHDFGVPVVAIDKTDSARGAQIARQLGIPLIVGDASREETLRAASVHTCRALLTLSTDDIINLEAALHGRAIKEDLRVVMRLYDGDFADRVQRAFGIEASNSVSQLAAPAFATAMMERQVIGALPLQGQVMLIAELPVAAGSSLDGQTLSSANDAGQSRVIALAEARGWGTAWAPADRPLTTGDRLIVVATQAGLGRLLARTAAPPPQE